MTVISRLSRGAALVMASLLVGTSAGAATLSVTDDVNDAFGYTDSWSDVGDFGIDLTRIDIDHGTKYLAVTARFTRLDEDSWTHLRVLLDTNRDGRADYAIIWGLGGSRSVLDVEGNTMCSLASAKQTLGAGGTLAVTVDRACLGNPSHIAVHVDALWMGTNLSGDDLNIVDSAPGEYNEGSETFSAPVASSNTGSATSPQPPKPVLKKTSVGAKLSKKTYVAGAKAVKLTVSPKGAGNPAGRVKITVKGKTVKNVPARAGKKVTYTFKKSLKPGKYKVKVTFTPNDRKRWKASSKTVTLTVKR